MVGEKSPNYVIMTWRTDMLAYCQRWIQFTSYASSAALGGVLLSVKVAHTFHLCHVNPRTINKIIIFHPQNGIGFVLLI